MRLGPFRGQGSKGWNGRRPYTPLAFAFYSPPHSLQFNLPSPTGLLRPRCDAVEWAARQNQGPFGLGIAPGGVVQALGFGRLGFRGVVLGQGMFVS